MTLHTVHRFANGMHEADGHLRWDIGGLYVEVRRGLRMLGREFPSVESIGIDTWAVDYALLDAGGTLLADPIAYRDTRTDAAVGRVHELVGADELYEINGLQHLPFTTLYQLDAERRGPIWERAAHAAAPPRPARLLAHGHDAHRVHERIDHRARRRPPPRVERRAVRSARHPAGVVPTARAAGHGPGHRHARRRRRARPARRPSW